MIKNIIENIEIDIYKLCQFYNGINPENYKLIEDINANIKNNLKQVKNKLFSKDNNLLEYSEKIIYFEKIYEINNIYGKT